VTCNTLVKGWAQKGDMDEAQLVVDGMVSRRLTPDAVSFNTLLNGCVDCVVFYSRTRVCVRVYVCVCACT
jgi:pentatricopeptide repeat protein